MISSELFDKLDAIARCLRKDRRPFGGIQLVLCGDFFQLPPVRDGNTLPNTPLFAFESAAWKAAVHHTVQLTRVFRQADTGFIGLLNSLRHGSVPADLYRMLAPCFRPLPSPVVDQTEPQIEHTRLYALKVDVARENNLRLQALPDEDHEFVAIDHGERSFVEQLEKHCPAESIVTLRRGAQVILVKNLEVSVGLVNGSRGVVTDFSEEGPVVCFTSGMTLTIRQEEFTLEVGGKVLASRHQVPLALAWALSVHKSQGMSIDRLYVDLSRVFEYGQAYVAISRARTLEGLRLARFPRHVIKAHPAVVKFYENLS
jgi:ATP-dependent DNA helicase PIF1